MSPSNPTSSKPNESSHDAEEAAKQNGDGPANAQKSHSAERIDELEDSVMSADSTKYSQAASSFYANNQDSFTKTASNLASNPDIKAMEEKVKNFAASSQVLMNVLDDVRRIHPFVDVAVIAFKAVVTLELKRRDNDQKVIVLQVKMQDMMEVFVQLRIVAPKQKDPSQRFTVAERLRRLCDTIADDIRASGNLCDTYSKKRTLVKFLKSPIYEARLADFAGTFSERQKELELALQVFTAHGVSAANKALADVQSNLQSTQESIKLIFEKLQTPLEKEIKKFIDSKGGPEKCARDERALRELIVLRLYGIQDQSEAADARPVPVPAWYVQPPTIPQAPIIPSPNYGVPIVPSPNYGSTAVPSPNYGSTAVPYMPSPQYGMGSNSSPYYGSTINPSPFPATTPMYYPQMNTVPGLSYQPSSNVPNHSRRSQSQTHGNSSSFQNATNAHGYRAYSQGDRSRSYSTHSQTQIRTSSPTRVSRSAYATPYSDPIPLPTVDEGANPDGAEQNTRGRSEDVGATANPTSYELSDLKEELSIDLDADLNKNMQVFFRKLDVQQKQLRDIEHAVVRQSERVISVVREGPHDRVTDPELREIWKEMGWKLGVPVLEFVLTLHDYFVAKYSDADFLDDYFHRTPSPGSTAQEQSVALRNAFTVAKNRAAEKWALKHISFANIIPLKEAFDADASGFVSVWEANKVASLRPRDWSFLQWLAYWAAGRHFTIWKYRQKIRAILRQMFLLLDEVLPTNRSIIDLYLESMYIVDQLLSSTIPCKDQLEDSLKEKVLIYQHAEEEAMERKLEALNYEIDGPDTLELIIGRSEIERNLFPLLFLLLRRHLATIRAGCTEVLDVDEMLLAEQSLEYIYDGIESRVSTLQILTAQNPAHFVTFGFGMYATYYNQVNPYEPSSFIYPEETQSDEDLDEWKGHVDLRYPSPRMFHTSHDDFDVPDIESCVSGVEGFWTGHLFDSYYNSVHGMIQIRIDTWNFTDGRFRGTGNYSKGTLSIEGKIQLEKLQGKLEATLLGEPDYEKDGKLRIYIWGTLDILREISQRNSISRTLPTQYTITGEWGQTPDTSLGSLYMSQTPAWVYHYRTLISRYEDRPLSLWRFACNAVLHQVRSRHGYFDKEFMTSKLSDLKRGAELTRYQYFLDALSPLDQEEMNRLLLTSTPWDARLFRSIARSHFFWASLHYKLTCSSCDRIILGPRFRSLDYYGTELCQSCFRRREELVDAPIIKIRHVQHDRDSMRFMTLALIAPPTVIVAPTPPPSPPSMYPTSGGSRPFDTPFDSPPPVKGGPNLIGGMTPSKRVRFALSSFKSSRASSTSPTSTRFERLLSVPRVLRTPDTSAMSTTADDFNKIDSDILTPDISASPLVLQCISCDSDINLQMDIFWVCKECYELKYGHSHESNATLDRYEVVVCTECELKDRAPVRDDVGHKVLHSLIRRPLRRTYHTPSILTRNDSKRKMVFDYLKRLFGAKDGKFEYNSDSA